MTVYGHHPQHLPGRGYHATHGGPGGQGGAVLVGDPGALADCHEDEACWDCSTMGNLICGSGAVLPDGTVITTLTYFGDQYPPPPGTSDTSASQPGGLPLDGLALLAVALLLLARQRLSSRPRRQARRVRGRART